MKCKLQNVSFENSTINSLLVYSIGFVKTTFLIAVINTKTLLTNIFSKFSNDEITSIQNGLILHVNC